MIVSCQYHDAEVCANFPGFKPPEREDALTINRWAIDVGPHGVDGVVAVLLGLAGSDPLTLTMGTDDARNLAAALVRYANAEDAKLDEDDDEEDDVEDVEDIEDDDVEDD